MSIPKLYQFSYSHECEKVRWLLDHKAVPHFRENLLPGPHVARMLALTGQRAVPVLELEGTPVAGSTAIVRAVEEAGLGPSLVPTTLEDAERAWSLVTYCDEHLGPALGVLTFSRLLAHPRYLSNLLSVGQSGPVKRAYRLMFPGVQLGLRLLWGVGDARKDQVARKQVEEAMTHLGDELNPSGYLVGTDFSIADMTAAALLSPLVPPPHSPYRLQRQLPASMIALRDSLRHHPITEWAESIYARYRGVSMAENGELRGSSVI